MVDKGGYYLKRFEVRLEDGLHEKIKRESFETGKSMQVLIIELLKEKYGEEKKGDK